MGVHQTPRRSTGDTTAIASGFVAALVAGVGFGVLLAETGRIASVAGIYGMESVYWGWGLHLVHSVVAGSLFAAVVATAVDGTPGLVRGTLAGLAYGIVLWIAFVALAFPLWMTYVVGDPRPIPYLHWLALAGLVLFGTVLGAVYALAIWTRTRSSSTV